MCAHTHMHAHGVGRIAAKAKKRPVTIVLVEKRHMKQKNRQAFSSHEFIIAWQQQWFSDTVLRKSSAFAATLTALIHILAEIAKLYGHYNNHTS